MDGLERLNALGADEARRELLRCCGSRLWAEAMASNRPFKDEMQLLECARGIWGELGPNDWREAFAGHPMIGEDALKAKFADTREWSKGEQAGLHGADEATIKALAEGNRAYEAKFGYIFIIYAQGKSAGEMLTLLKRRLANDAQSELEEAALEQLKITQLRLKKLISEK